VLSLLRIQGFAVYLLVVFVNAFVDLGHKVVIQSTALTVFEGTTLTVVTALVNVLMLMPFILLFSPSGFVSDKYPKHRVMQLSAWIKLASVLIILVAYHQGWFWLAFTMTLALSVQAAIYGPAKFGYLRELTGDGSLASANGMTQAVSATGMLGGALVFAAGFSWLIPSASTHMGDSIIAHVSPLGWVMAVLAVAELVLAYQLPNRQKAAISPHEHFDWRAYFKGNALRENLLILQSRRVVWLSIIGLTTFWAVSQAVAASFPGFARSQLGITDPLVIQSVFCCAGLGLALGSLLAGRWSREHIEVGLIPIGAGGFAIFLGLMTMVSDPWWLALNFTVLGIFGGLFIVPLNTLVQYHARPNEIGRVMAGNLWVQNIGMLALLCVALTLASLGISSAQFFWLMMLIAAVGAAYTVIKLPHSLTRLIAAALVQGRYKVSVVGFENLPKSGGVLLLGNHISWVDWAMIQIASPRPVRFVMLRSYYDQWYLQPFLRFFGVIPISRGQSRDSLKLINQALKAGDVVCLFPEGAISRTGSLGTFHSGYEYVVDDVDGVIVPFYLHGLWGSRLSRARSEKLRKNTARGIRREVVVTLGPPLPMATTAEQLKQKVFELSFNAWEYRSQQFDPLPLAIIRAARERLGAASVIDSTGTEFSNARLLAAVAGFAREMRRIDTSRHIGILLPASSAAIISNVAVMLNAQVAVNINFTTSVGAIRQGVENAQIKTVYTSEKFIEKLSSRGINTEKMLQGLNVIYLERLKDTLSKPFLTMAFFAVHLLPAYAFYRVFGKKSSINDPAAIIFSSGSEGTPKGIVLSHRNFMANIKQISDVLKSRDNDVIMGSLPPFHSFGLTVTTLLPLVEGISVVCHPDPTDVFAIGKAICRYEVTIMCATATFLRLYSRNKKLHPLMLDSLRVVVAGAEKLSLDVREEFQQRFNKTIFEGYGATETTPVASVNVPDQIDSQDLRIQIGTKIGTVGLPLPGCSFRVVDPDTLAPMPVGEDGLILISGTQVMLGYLNDEEKTRSVIVELDGRRWYKTGDKGHLDTDGFLTIVDRYSRFAKLGGEMVSLGAVEVAIKQVLPQTDADILAVNIPDEKKGERVVLLSTVAIDMSQLRQQLLDEAVNPLMIPSEIYVCDAIPKLGSGKTDFGAARQLALTLEVK
jgi:acyl-[acyl-carrier-protein]-phospholipid O-acyltransferase/long-chain-fatty-acid--[acyl-carrier-protein] ligase